MRIKGEVRKEARKDGRRGKGEQTKEIGKIKERCKQMMTI